tara:strand:+ start:12115 stop:12276 length:162 start_codon:yes stop_codon:yes gene_type:complete
MAKPTTEELQAELQEVVNKYNQAQATVKQCEKRFTELTAIINDRNTPETEETT